MYEQRLQKVWVLRMKHLTIVLAFLMMIGSQISAESRSILTNAITAVDANVIFVRHTLASGYGDPANFSLIDCNTQRNSKV